MNKMIRSIRSKLGKAIVLCAFAGVLPVDTSLAFNSQESVGEQQRRRQHGELTFTQIDFTGASITGVSGINNRGQMVGFFLDAGSVKHGFLLDDGAFTPIDPPGATVTEANGINDRGQIVGAFVDAGGARHGYLLDNGAFT